MPEYPRPLPLPDRDTAPFWEAQARHELVFQRCTACKAVRYPVGPLCPECRTFDFEWIASSGRGTIHSFTVVRHQTHPAFPAPYTIVLAEMAEGPRVIAQLRAPEGAEFGIGSPVEVAWDDSAEQPLVAFVLA
jgi:uncharacterized OB-fold protein